MRASYYNMDIEKALNIRGWMSNSELELLAQIASKSKVIIEFGSYFGKSTRAMADNTLGVIYAYDPWNGIYYDDNDQPINILKAGALDAFYENLGDRIHAGKVIPKIGYSSQCELTYADFVFIDGDHRYEECKKDIQLAKRLVTKGVIAGHDYNHPDWPGVAKAVSEEFPDGIELVDTIWYRRF